MANRNWSEFEGMFHNPPTIRIGGDYFPLDLNHKVVFASNPVTYGNGLFVAVSISGTNRVMTSPDGVTWTAKALPERAMRSLYDPVYPGVFVPAGIELTAAQRAEAAERDAARYRWLRADGPNDDWTIWIPVDDESLEGKRLMPEQLDAAIDAAIAAL